MTREVEPQSRYLVGCWKSVRSSLATKPFTDIYGQITHWVGSRLKVTANEVTAVIINLNDRLRKRLKCKIPARLMAEHMTTIVA